MRTCSDRNYGIPARTVDPSVVMATCIRLKASAIATLDLKHFAAVAIPGSPKLFPRDLR
jgi:hypothetical protein